MNKVIIVDDHEIVAKGISALVNDLMGFEVILELRNGLELQQALKSKRNIPDIILLDINMPVMNGFETMQWLSAEYPEIPVLALSVNDDEESVIKMLRAGVKGYLLKQTGISELKLAMETILSKGFYASEIVNSALLNSMHGKNAPLALKPREQEFLNLVCSEMTYQQIADAMFLSPKTVDHYRIDLFEKFGVKTRVGLVMAAFKLQMVTL